MRTLEATDSEMLPDHSLSSIDAPIVDLSVALLVDTQHTATTMWAMVAHQLILKGFREIRTASLVAYAPDTQTYTVWVDSDRTAQQLIGRYGKHVQGTLIGLHLGAHVVFVTSHTVPRVSTA